MSMDGRYIAKSQGRRCEYVHGWTVYRGAMDGKERCMFHGWTVYRGAMDGKERRIRKGERYISRNQGGRCEYAYMDVDKYREYIRENVNIIA